MKKTYENPALILYPLETADLLTLSGTGESVGWDDVEEIMGL